MIRLTVTVFALALSGTAFAQEPPAPPEELVSPASPPVSIQIPVPDAVQAVPAAAGAAQPAPAIPATAVRLKDVASLQGQTSTPLVGYGLVVGLNKTGDRRQTIFPAQTLATMLERFGQTVSPTALKVENIAAVLITAQVGPYAQAGAHIDVTVASVGDARSLQGGVLMPASLRGPDGAVIVLAQGPLTLGGYGAGGGGNSVQVNHLNVGRVPGGGRVEVSRSNGFGTVDVVLAGRLLTELSRVTDATYGLRAVLERHLPHRVDKTRQPAAANHDPDVHGRILSLAPRCPTGRR